MQLGDPRVLETSSGKAVMAVAPEEGVNNGGALIGGVDANCGEEKGRELVEGDEGDKMNCGANRWPRQETLALLKIRSDMDAVFRASSLKGPLWKEVSRNLAELGYHRSAKKCKEKFENVYKYHKRTKESRSGKPEGKSYKFFDELQAFENQFTVSNNIHPPRPQPNTLATTTTTKATVPISNVTITTSVPSTNPTLISPPPPPTNATITSPTVVTNPGNIPSSQPYNSLPNVNNLFSTTATTLTTTSTSSSTASDEGLEEKRHRKKRKYWKEYFKRLTRHVLAKQEEMHNKFLEAIDKRDREHMAQRDTWRMQEMERINREHEVLVQERSTAAAKDAAVIAFLHKLTGHQNHTQVSGATNFLQQPPPPPQQPPPPLLVTQIQPLSLQQQQRVVDLEMEKSNNGHSGGATVMSSPTSSRWPKAEIHALIRLRTSLEAKYQENGPKAPLWEDISAGMQRLGYNRSAKRCKEKWENINKYFKKMKERNKKRKEDSKTCPYFDELEALYNEKTKFSFHNNNNDMKPNEMIMEPLMVQPEQQWRPPPQYEHQPLEEEREEVIDNDNDDDVDVEGINGSGDSVADEGGSRYEIATNKLSSVDTVE